MNFQKFFGPLTKPREDKFFDEIIGDGHIKRLFGLALRSHEPTHVLLARDFARIIADVVWNTSRNLRDCVRIGKLASSEGVDFLIDKFLYPRADLNRRFIKFGSVDSSGVLNGCRCLGARKLRGPTTHGTVR